MHHSSTEDQLVNEVTETCFLVVYRAKGWCRKLNRCLSLPCFPGKVCQVNIVLWANQRVGWHTSLHCIWSVSQSNSAKLNFLTDATLTHLNGWSWRDWVGGHCLQKRRLRSKICACVSIVMWPCPELYAMAGKQIDWKELVEVHNTLPTDTRTHKDTVWEDYA